MYLKYVLCYKFTDNMQNADDMVFDQRVQNVTSDIHDNLRLCTGNIQNYYVVQHVVWTNMPIYIPILHIVMK